MDHRGCIRISVPSIYPYVYTEESSSMSYGVAAPLQIVNCLKKIRRITPFDIVTPYDGENENLEIKHEGFSIDDFSYSEISPVGKKYLTMETKEPVYRRKMYRQTHAKTACRKAINFIVCWVKIVYKNLILRLIRQKF